MTYHKVLFHMNLAQHLLIKTIHLSPNQQSLTDMRTSTVKINLQHELPYEIPSHILIRIQEMECNFISSGLGGDCWPKSYSPTEELCVLCGATLGALRPHPGQKEGESGYLLTNCVPLEPIKISVKQCEKCKGLYQVFPYDLGLINISDKILVSIDTFLDLREQFKRGVPLTTAIESKLANILRKATKKVSVSREYVVDLLYNGFYYFEMITKRNLDDTICGICGVVGETYFGDGNEKNCCSRKEIVYDTTGANEVSPMTLEDFLQVLKSFWVERTSFTRTLRPFSVKSSSVPPIIAPKLAGPVIYNSEMEKKSAHLGDSKKKIKGDPALLHVQIRELGINMDSISKMNAVELKDLCTKCSIPVTSNNCLRSLWLQSFSLSRNL